MARAGHGELIPDAASSAYPIKNPVQTLIESSPLYIDALERCHLGTPSLACQLFALFVAKQYEPVYKFPIDLLSTACKAVTLSEITQNYCRQNKRFI